MSLAAGRFVGQSVLRREDRRLLSGHGSFVDDVVVPGMLHVAFLRSDVARGRVEHLDVEEARGLDGVFAVLTAAELAPVLAGPMLPTMFADGTQGPSAPVRPLADGDVRFVGDPIALVVAESRYVAEDACELVELSIEPLPPVLAADQAASLDSAIVHPELGSNLASRAAAPPDPQLDAVISSAAHQVSEVFRQHRHANVPMETRGIVSHWDPFSEQLQVWMSSQNPHEVKLTCSRILGIAESHVHVTQADVGGGFGQKYFMPRDEMTVVLASRLLGQPLKWIEDRRENLIASNHARMDRAEVTLCTDHEGHFLAARIDHLEEAGAYPTGGTGGTGMFVGLLFPGPYRLPKLAWSTSAVWTNTCGRGAYRGPWMFETVAREQLVDVVARSLGVDPLELRRRNVVSRDELPYAAASGMVYDHVSPAETLEQAASIIGYDDFRREQEAALSRGRHLGIGIGLYLEPQTGMGALGVEAATVRVTPSGKVEVFTGSGSHGQGLETTMAQVVADELGVPLEDVVVRQGDTDATPFGAGTGGSRSAPILSSACRQASTALRDKIVRIASHLLEAATEDLVVEGGAVSVRGTPSVSVRLTEVARLAYRESDSLPSGVEPGLEVTSRYKAPPVMYSNACHMCTCEVDVETGEVGFLRYVVSEDCGVMINPMVVEGQIAGGVVQGIGGVLYEHLVYDESGNPLTTTFLDYLLPTAAEVPLIEYGHVETPAATPGGHKGMGEGGAIGAPPAVFNAVADALAPLGVRLTDQPLTPSALLEAIEAART
jgi:aerobic carbon-monoxide dehydrogenase large subunit